MSTTKIKFRKTYSGWDILLFRDDEQVNDWAINQESGKLK